MIDSVSPAQERHKKNDTKKQASEMSDLSRQDAHPLRTLALTRVSMRSSFACLQTY